MLVYGGNKNNKILIIIEFKLLVNMCKFIIQIISILSKIVNSLSIHRQVVTQSAKHQKYYLCLPQSIFVL
jgi:hypothetical protein